MLVLSRKLNQQITIGDDIVVTVLRTERGTVKLGIDAPRRMTVRRGELPGQIGDRDGPVRLGDVISILTLGTSGYE